MFDKIQMILIKKTSISNNRISQLNNKSSSFYKFPMVTATMIWIGEK